LAFFFGKNNLKKVVDENQKLCESDSVMKNMNTKQIIKLVSNNARRAFASRHHNNGFLRRCDYKEIKEIIQYLRSLKKEAA
jgi:hypothetical protein